jgi:hypothetical protein
VSLSFSPLFMGLCCVRVNIRQVRGNRSLKLLPRFEWHRFRSITTLGDKPQSQGPFQIELSDRREKQSTEFTRSGKLGALFVMGWWVFVDRLSGCEKPEKQIESSNQRLKSALPAGKKRATENGSPESDPERISFEM